MVQATGKGPGWKAEAQGGKYIPTAACSYVLGKAAGQKNLSKYMFQGRRQNGKTYQIMFQGRQRDKKTYQNTGEAVKTAAAYFL